ncbi:MAG: alpha/beta hydrolase, partial [Monoglobales bacterium]
AKAELAKYLHLEYGLSLNCVPVGMSCGGLHALRFAQYYPEHISMLYLDAPVMNFLSCPMGMGVGQPLYVGIKEMTDEYDFTPDTLITYRDHPIDNMAGFIENNLTVLMVCGDNDVVVPYSENGELLEKYYNEHGGRIKVIKKQGCGHHPHGLEDPTPIVDFILKNS